jgi:hypothetical protein
MAKLRAEQEDREEKSRGGRPPKDARVPQVSLSEALAFTKRAFDKEGLAHKSFSGMAEAMEVTEAFGKRAFGEMMNQYGLITREEDGAWHITDLGRRAVLGEKVAVEDVFCKNEIMKDLYLNLKDRTIGKDFLVDFIKRKRYTYTTSPEIIAEKFLDGMNYLSGLAEDTKGARQSINPNSKMVVQNFLKLIQLQYALNPPKGASVGKLAKDIASSLAKDKESALRTLGSSIENHKADEKILYVIVENALQIMRDKYSEVLGDIETEVREKEEGHTAES